MSKVLIISITLIYLALLFGVAYYVDRKGGKQKSWTNSPFIYALSLAVYCTAWTFFGSVGRSASSGAGFLPIYLGPTILAPIWILVLRKIVIICKKQRITSIADFISSRYGKSAFLGILAVVIAVFGVIPYISIQLKAISSSLDLLMSADPLLLNAHAHLPFYEDSAFYVTILLALFAILFGTRHLDPNERHAGLVAAVAFESIFKLLAFLAVGLFVVYGLFDGFGDLFAQAIEREDIAQLFTFEEGMDGTQWFWLTLVSMFAFLLLPRQFHVAVVENDNPNNIQTASWLVPLYLLLINLFVIPIAIAGNLLLQEQGIEPDTYVLTLPLLADQEGLAFLAALGGFSAATSMVIVATVALSIMISNNLLLPLVINAELVDETKAELPGRLLGIRRVSIICVLLLSYSYFKFVGESYSLVSIGLISFLAVAQFAPPVIAGLYWKKANRKGAIAGLIIGFLIWAFTLPFPTLIEAGLFSTDILEYGIGGIHGLKPQSLLGLDHLDQFSHAAFWSLGLNTLALVGISLYSKANATEIQQADLFVNIYKYQEQQEDYSVIQRQASIDDIKMVLTRFLGIQRARTLLKKFESNRKLELNKLETAPTELINFTETQLTGALGAASSKLILASIAKTDAISLEEMLTALEQTQEILQYSKALEKKGQELEKLTKELRRANHQLQELDQMKAEFISTVTHELRTPITSIKAFAKILAENPDLSNDRKNEFLNVLVSESERIARLINQVLDLEKIQATDQELSFETIDFIQLLEHTATTFSQQVSEKGIDYRFVSEIKEIIIMGNKDRLTQVLVNLWSNALKFADPQEGQIQLELQEVNKTWELVFRNNGKAIPPEKQDTIFDKFTQVQDRNLGKPQGSGLGLYICRHILEQHQGSINLVFHPGWATSFLVRLPKLKD
ncbi:MAG: ATP-binding protein [Lewinella sp.]|uniref:ATP-binding protein n=1 Tax=Lewinella sp. TaxID=2004506 RepID=UPI003D6B4D8E